MGKGYFQFFTKNRPQKRQKRTILRTSQANGGARAPPPPPGYATDSTQKNCKVVKLRQTAQKCSQK